MSVFETLHLSEQLENMIVELPHLDNESSPQVREAYSALHARLRQLTADTRALLSGAHSQAASQEVQSQIHWSPTPHPTRSQSEIPPNSAGFSPPPPAQVEHVQANAPATPPPDPEPQEIQVGKDQSAAQRRRVEKRAQSILSNVQKDKITAEEVEHYFRNIIAPLGRSQVSREDQALARIYKGYHRYHDHQWATTLAEFKPPDGGHFSVAKYLDEMDECDQVESNTKRLLRINYSLRQVHGSEAGHAYALLLLSQIQALRFGYQWNSKDSDKPWKTNMYRQLFQEDLQHKHKFDGLNDQQRDQVMKDQQSNGTYRQWRKQMERVITARNRLLDAYEFFGIAILLDPFWNVERLASNRSSDFPHLLKYLRENTPDIEHGEDGREVQCLSPLHADNMHTFLSIVKIILGARGLDYILDFIDEHPTLIERMN